MKIQQIPVEKILIEESPQMRVAGNDESYVQEIADAMNRGDKIQPIDVFGGGSFKNYICGDGIHRVLAAIKIGRKKIEANVRRGYKDEALIFALGANAYHGKRRTNADKHNCVVVALKKFSKQSDRSIAEICRVSDKTVGEVRRELESTAEIPQLEARQGADGKTRQVPPPRPATIPPRKASAPPARKSEPQEFLDATGIAVPEESLPLWDEAFSRSQRLLTLASEIRSEIRNAQDANDPVFRECDHTDILAKLDMVYTDLKRAKPYAVCPDCNGVIPKGCSLCRGRGLLSEFLWKTAVPEQKKQLRNAKETEAA